MQKIAPYTYKANSGKVFIDSENNIFPFIVALNEEDLSKYIEIEFAEYINSKNK